ncbi:MAG: hypothetical protein IPL65_17805 [Lewinellaceae bacterium]|nr:hypothetical protein [Lewinellaceae bacterium]
MNNKFLLSCLLMLAAFGQQLQAQGLFACTGAQPPASTCAQTCLVCNLNGITGINNLPLPPNTPNTLCQGGLTLQNPRWYGFVAGSANITINIQPSNCTGNNGLEAAVLRECNKDVVCAPGPNNGAGPNGNFALTMTNLIVGKPYQLVIDGYLGDVCNYTITVPVGSTIPPPLGTVDSIVGLQQVCPNATTTYTVPPVDNAVSYTWTAPIGSKINGGSNSLVLPGDVPGNNSVEVTFGNVGGFVCVTASNACSPSVTTCLQISNTPLTATILDPLVICNEETPWEWPEEPHNGLFGPGTYNLTSSPYQSYLGCDSIVKQTVKILPANVKTLPLVYLCKDECFVINGLDYCESGSYQETLTSYQGCDSLVNFTLYKIPVNAVAAQPDTITCAVTSVPLTGAGSSVGNTITYRWINDNGQTISNAITANATAPGMYHLIVTNYVGGLACADTASVNVPGNLTPPLAEAGPDMVYTCTVTQLTLQGSGSTGPDISYFWKALIGGNIVSGSTTLNPIVNAPGTYSLRVTDNHNGCTAVSNAVVNADTIKPSVITQGGTYTCTNPTVTLQITTNGANPSFVWTGPNGFMSTQQNPVVNVAGTYSITVTNNVNGCTKTGSALVVANNLPPGAAASGGSITCAATTVTLNGNSPTMGTIFQWSGPNGYSSTQQNPVVNAVGNYQLLATGLNGCTSSALAVVNLNTTPPGADLSVSGNLNCNNASVNLLSTSIANPANLIHVWTLPNGTTDTTGTVSILPVSIPGLYSVLVSNNVNGCTSTGALP